MRTCPVDGCDRRRSPLMTSCNSAAWPPPTLLRIIRSDNSARLLQPAKNRRPVGVDPTRGGPATLPACLWTFCPGLYTLWTIVRWTRRRSTMPGPAPKPASKRRRRTPPVSYGAATPTTAPAASPEVRELGTRRSALVGRADVGGPADLGRVAVLQRRGLGVGFVWSCSTPTGC